MDQPASDLYGASYYAAHCGPVPYARNDHWLQMFGRVADELVRAFSPRRVFDAGCALGLLVESLWDRGVEAYGRDISAFAIGEVRLDVHPFCGVGSIAEPIDGEYDLLTCIEVLEHMPEDEALRAIGVMAAAAPRILFSSSPNDFSEPTHCNVRPPIYWLGRWAEVGFAPSTLHDAGYLAPHAYVLERSEAGRTPREIAAFADRIRHRVAMAQLGNRLSELNAELQTRDSLLRDHEAALEQREHDIARLSSALETAQQDLVSVGASHAVRLQQLAAEYEEKVRAEHEKALAERQSLTTHSMRLRANAAQRSADARAEVAEVSAELAEARNQAAALEAANHQVRAETLAVLAQKEALLSSTAWRATWPIRRVATALPGPVRGTARRGLKTAYWTFTGQLGTRLRDRQRVIADALALNQTDLFDPAWYATTYPDVAASGLDPAFHYALLGGRQGRDPGPRFCPKRYHVMHPEVAELSRPALFHFLEVGQELGWSIPERLPQPATSPIMKLPSAVPTAEAESPDVHLLLKRRFPGLEPLRTYAAPHDGPRVTIVTDSINSGSLYGGVATALILAALLATRLGAGLRLVTRLEEPTADNIGAVFKVHGIVWPGNIELLYSPPGAGRDIPIGKQDIFLTTSWWTTWATCRSVDASRIVYLLQEDERGFYPLGDDHLRCTEMLSDPALAYVVNTGLLMGHFTNEGLAPGGLSFEPAFPTSAYHEVERHHSQRSNFFFYARPNNLRNLFWRGLEAISAAMEERVLDPDNWAFHFVGDNIPKILLPGGVQPIVSQNLAWSDYAGLVRQMDLGLSLMDTPHPSYPPLDLAASGAVVVTNRFGSKTSLQAFSSNIVAVESTVPALVAGLKQGKALAMDKAARSTNFRNNGLQRDWTVSMAPVLDSLSARFGH